MKQRHRKHRRPVNYRAQARAELKAWGERKAVELQSIAFDWLMRPVDPAPKPT
jgi:hypothetical protein